MSTRLIHFRARRRVAHRSRRPHSGVRLFLFHSRSQSVAQFGATLTPAPFRQPPMKDDAERPWHRCSMIWQPLNLARSRLPTKDIAGCTWQPVFSDSSSKFARLLQNWPDSQTDRQTLSKQMRLSRRMNDNPDGAIRAWTWSTTSEHPFCMNPFPTLLALV